MNEKNWGILIKRGVDINFKNWCNFNISETDYSKYDISCKGKKIKMDTIDQLKNIKIMVEYSKNRGRIIDNRVNSFYVDFCRSYYEG